VRKESAATAATTYEPKRKTLWSAIVTLTITISDIPLVLSTGVSTGARNGQKGAIRKMPNSLRCRIKKWCYQGVFNEKDRDRLINGLDCADDTEPLLKNAYDRGYLEARTEFFNNRYQEGYQDGLKLIEKIRAELTKYYVDPYNRNAFRYTTVSLLDVLDLIDKYLKEYEG
jgi:hypothetical protein